MTTTDPRLINVVIEVDSDFVDADASTGMTSAGHIELQNALTQIGTVMLTKRLTPPVPAPPTVPISSERTRAYARRREALEKAALIAARQQVGRYDADIIVNMARLFEGYLNGEKAGE